MQRLSNHPWGRVFTPLLAFGGLLTAVELGRPSWRDAPPPMKTVARRSASSRASRQAAPVSQPIIGFLDMLNGNPVLFGKESFSVEVSGWTACSISGSKMDRIEILIDGVQRAESRDFFSRPDVAEAFGRDDFEMSGWKIAVPLSGVSPGEHTLVARGVASTGQTAELPAFRLNVLK